MKAAAHNIDEYIAGFPTGTQALLKQLRTAIRKSAPEAEELISYGMPAFKYHGMLVYFAAYEKHIGFYPLPSAIVAFKNELAIFKSAKGSVQFPIDKKLPLPLIREIISFRKMENLEKAAVKVKKK